MGMFDSFFFEEGVLPENKVPTNFEFQTKDLSCVLDNYFVLRDGTVKQIDLYGEEQPVAINDVINVYSHEFLYDNEKDIFNRKHLKTKFQEFKIVIVNNKLVHAEKLRESGYEEPGSCDN